MCLEVQTILEPKTRGSEVRKKKAEEALKEWRERTADTLFSDLGTVAVALEDGDISITEDNFVPTARCKQDTEERQLVTRSGLHRLRCGVGHLHHEQAMRKPYSARQFCEVQHNEVDVIAGDTNAAAYKYWKKQKYQDLCENKITKASAHRLITPRMSRH